MSCSEVTGRQPPIIYQHCQVNQKGEGGDVVSIEATGRVVAALVRECQGISQLTRSMQAIKPEFILRRHAFRLLLGSLGHVNSIDSGGRGGWCGSERWEWCSDREGM